MKQVNTLFTNNINNYLFVFFFLFTDDVHHRFPSTVPRDDETHGGDDVAIFSTGPWAHLFTGSFQQSSIPRLLAYAACIKPESHCNNL